jgi:hypothetical protein
VDDKSGSGAVLAVVSAMVLQHEDFGFLAGIAIFVVCLSLNQIAYLIGETLVYRGWLARDRGGADSLRGDGRAQIDKGRASSGP